MQAKKNILFILHVPPPVHGSSIVGGFIKESTLINNTFNSKYINLGTSKSIDEIGKNGLAKLVIYFKIILQVVKQLMVFKPDLVYLAMTAKGVAFYKDLVMALLAKLFGVQLVIHFHNKGVSQYKNKWLDNFLYKIVFNNTKVILLSTYLYNDIKTYVKEKDVYYCPNGIPEVELDRNTKFDKNNVVKLLFLSNLMESKGVYILLEALHILKQKGIQFSCNFAGGVGDVSEVDFKATVKSLQLQSHVSYRGKKFGNEKAVIFTQADIFIHPSYSDCFPLVLLEALQFGLPLISTYEGAIPEIVEEGITGFLVPQKDVQALAHKLEILIKNPQLRIEMGNAARAKYEKYYTLEHFENNFVHCLKQTVSNNV